MKIKDMEKYVLNKDEMRKWKSFPSNLKSNYDSRTAYVPKHLAYLTRAQSSI